MYCRIQLDSDLLVAALEESGMTARMYNFNHDGKNVNTIVRVQGGDLEVFEAELNDESTIETWDQIHRTEDIGEYRVQYSRDKNVAGYERIFPHSGSLNQAIYQDEWQLHMFFPKKEDLVSYEQELEDLGFEVSIERVLRSSPEQVDILTEKQREILLLAKRRGYFEIPRNVELSELADELDIATASAGERLRRGVDSVLSSIFVEREMEE